MGSPIGKTMRRVVAVMVLATFAPGCKVFNPNVTFPRPECPSESKTANCEASGGCKKSTRCESRRYTLPQAVAYAESAVAEYDSAIAQNNWFTATFGVLVVGIAAAALGVGITDGATTAISALGAAGAGTAGIGLLLSDRSRNKFYIQGQEKIVCAVAAVAPLTLSSEQVDRFHDDVAKISTGSGNVTRALGAVQSLLPSGPSTDPSVLRAKASVERAEKTLQAASEIVGPATKLDLQLTRAGTDLVVAVDQIGAEVAKAIDGTTATLEGANAIIAGLATGAKTITDIPTGFDAERVKNDAEVSRGESAAFMEDAPDPLESATAQLDSQVVELAGAIGRVAAFSSAIGEPGENLKACQLDLEALALTLKPSGDITFDHAAGGTRALIASGKKPFSAEILEAPVEGLTCDQPVLLGSKIVVKAEANKVKAGEYTLHVVDGAGHDAYATIKVTEKKEEK